ncbi:beta strand repeat-containing protein, partial [Exilibacterium tricleocarpae]|uniref:beta strand repeat-containing protein n=1 Tax=Exilibacterium tricleocarpae TaxID=2591008 RepID=UPI0015D3A96B
LDGNTGAANTLINDAGALTLLSATTFSAAGGAVSSVSNIAQVSNTGSLTGSGADESFSWDGTQLGVGALDFLGVITLNGGGGTGDSLALSGAAAAAGVDLGSAVGAFTVLSASNLQVTGGMESVSNTGDLTGSNNADNFDWNGTRVRVSNIDFTEVGALNGGSGGGDTLASTGGGVQLADTLGAFDADGLTVTGGIDSVSNTGDLTGSDVVNESFTWDGSGIDLGDGLGGTAVRFTGVGDLAGGASGADSLAATGAGVQLGNTLGAFTTAGLSVSGGIETVANTGDLTGSDAVNESFTWDGSGIDLDDGAGGTAARFTGVGDLAGGGGDDSLATTGAGVQLTDTAGGFTTAGLTVTGGIETVSNVVSLVGTAGDDSFDIVAANRVVAAGVIFDGTDVVDALGQVSGDNLTNTVQGNPTFNAAGNFVIEGVEFIDIETVDVAASDTVVGTDGDDIFELIGPNSIRFGGAGGTVFSGTRRLDGFGNGANGDSLELNGAGVILGENQTFLAGSDNLFVENIENVTGTGTITGNDGFGETFVLSSLDQVTVDTHTAVTFFDVARINGGGTDTLDNTNVNGVGNNAGLTLTADGFTAGNNAVIVNGIETVIGAGDILGSGGGDVFSLAAPGQVTVNNITYQGVTLIDGGAGRDQLTGNGDWLLSSLTAAGEAAGTVDSTAFSNIEQLVGAANATLTGSDQNLTWTLDTTTTVQLTAGGTGVLELSGLQTLRGGTGDDNFVFAGLPRSVDGGAGAGRDTVTSTAAANWEVTGAGAGTIDGSGFTGIESLQGGAGTDVFRLTAGSIGAIDAGAGADEIRLGAATFTNLDGGAGVDTLIGTNNATDWFVNGTNSGTVDGASFANIETLQGGSAVDKFTLASGSIGNVRGGGGDDQIFLNGAAVNGSVSGEAGRDEINAAGNWLLAVLDAVNGANGTVGGIAFADMESIVGAGGTLTGADVNTNWTVDGAGSGRLANADAGAVAVTFSGIDNLRGGAGVDSFVLSSGSIGSVGGGGGADAFLLAGAAVGSLDGGDGIDTITGSPAGLTWVVDAVNGNSVDGVDFSNVEQLQGGAGDDTFNLLSGSTVTVARGGGGNDNFIMGGATIMVVGETGIDTVTGPAVGTDWVLTTAGGGGRVGDNNFSSMEILQGGAGVDTFDLADGSISEVRGGGGADRFNLGGATVSGTIDGQDGADTLAGRDTDNNWEVTGAGSGSVGDFTFANMDTLIGGTGIDNFQLTGGSITDIEGGLGDDTFVIDATVINGTLDGGAGSDSLSGPGSWTLSAVSDNGVAAGTVTVNNYRFAGMESLIGDSSAQATLTGSNQSLMWTTPAPGTGTVSTSAPGATAVSFTGMTGFAGGTGQDTLIATGESRTWTLLGGAVDRENTGFALGSDSFSGFERLEDNTGAVAVETDFAAGLRADQTMQLGSVTLAYGSSPVSISGAAGVTGQVAISALTLSDINGSIALNGDLDTITANLAGAGSITLTDSNGLSIDSLITQGGNITVSAPGDINVNKIDTSGTAGTVTLTSAEGSLRVADNAESGVNISAGNVVLTALFGDVGTPVTPFSINAPGQVEVRGLQFVNPLFSRPGPRVFISEGTRLPSGTETLASSAVRSAVQSNIDNIELLDPAIFTALTPYSVEEDALTLPEDQREDIDEFEL